jgi:hypothetical protein
LNRSLIDHWPGSRGWAARTRGSGRHL